MGTAATRITVHSPLHIHDLKPEFAFPARGGVLFPFSGMVLSTSAAILDFSGGYCDDGIATNWRPKSVRLSMSFPTDYLSGWSVSIPAVSSRGYAYNVSFYCADSPTSNVEPLAAVQLRQKAKNTQESAGYVVVGIPKLK